MIFNIYTFTQFIVLTNVAISFWGLKCGNLQSWTVEVRSSVKVWTSVKVWSSEIANIRGECVPICNQVQGATTAFKGQSVAICNRRLWGVQVWSL